MKKRPILFSEENKFFLIVNPYAIWENRFFDIICPIFYKYFWRHFNLKCGCADSININNMETIMINWASVLQVKKPSRIYRGGKSNFLFAADYAKLREISNFAHLSTNAINLNYPVYLELDKEKSNLYPKVYIAKNPYHSLADKYLIDKISYNQDDINSFNFFNYIKSINCNTFTNSYYTHSKENECLIDYVIFPESLKQDLINLYRIYRKFKNAKEFLIEFNLLKDEDQLILDRIKNNTNITLQDLIEKTGDMSKSGNVIFYKKLYTQEIIDYLKPYFDVDFLNYKYCFDI